MAHALRVYGLLAGFGLCVAATAAVLTAGFHVQPWLGFEGSLQLQGAQSFPWAFRYQFANNTNEVVTHRRHDRSHGDVRALGHVVPAMS